MSVKIISLIFILYFPSLILAWTIIGYSRGINKKCFYNILTLQEYNGNRTGTVSGVLFTEAAFRLVVLLVLLIISFIANKEGVYIIVICTLIILNNLNRSFACKNRLLNKAQYLYNDILGIRNSLVVAESGINNNEYQHLMSYTLEILEKFWDSVDKHLYLIELDAQKQIIFINNTNMNITQLNEETFKEKIKYTKHNLSKLEKGILNLKFEISKY